MVGTSQLDVQVNAETVNDLGKRGLHRLIARRLRRDPALMARAREEVERWRERYGDRFFVTAWDRILTTEDRETIARRLTARTEEMTELRTASPFARVVGDLLTEDQVVHLWQTSRKILKRTYARERN